MSPGQIKRLTSDILGQRGQKKHRAVCGWWPGWDKAVFLLFGTVRLHSHLLCTPPPQVREYFYIVQVPPGLQFAVRFEK